MSIAAEIPEAQTRLNMVRVFDAPRALVWKMWTDPAHMAVWWAPEHFTTPVAEVDPRPGGDIHIVMRAPDGSDYPFDGDFEVVDEPERLVMRTWVRKPDGSIWFEVRNTIRLDEVDGRTTMTFDAQVLTATADAVGPLGGMEIGWNQTLNKLDAHIRDVVAG